MQLITTHRLHITELKAKIPNITPYQNHLLDRLNDANSELRATCRENYRRYFFTAKNDTLLYEAIIKLGEIESSFG